MFDLARDMGPPPTGVNLIEQRARRIVKPWRRGLLRLEMIAVEARPSLQWIMVPGAAREILIHVKIAMAQHVEPGPLLVADDYRQRILELLAEPHVEHAGVERAAPHTDVEPTRTRERTSDGRGQNEARGRGEHAGIVTAEWGRPGGPAAVTPLCGVQPGTGRTCRIRAGEGRRPSRGRGGSPFFRVRFRGDDSACSASPPVLRV